MGTQLAISCQPSVCMSTFLGRRMHYAGLTLSVSAHPHAGPPSHSYSTASQTYQHVCISQLNNSCLSTETLLFETYDDVPYLCKSRFTFFTLHFQGKNTTMLKSLFAIFQYFSMQENICSISSYHWERKNTRRS